MTAEEKIIDLEIRFTHQENHIQELDKIIYQQQQSLDILKEQIQNLQHKIKNSTEYNILSSSDEAPPPHY